MQVRLRAALESQLPHLHAHVIKQRDANVATAAAAAQAAKDLLMAAGLVRQVDARRNPLSRALCSSEYLVNLFAIEHPLATETGSEKGTISPSLQLCSRCQPRAWATRHDFPPHYIFSTHPAYTQPRLFLLWPSG